MKKTENFLLPQWESGDRVLRGDINAAFAAVDAALAAQGTAVLTGGYVGDGDPDDRKIELGRRPKLVLISPAGKPAEAVHHELGIFADGFAFYMISDGRRYSSNLYLLVTLDEDGFTISYDGANILSGYNRDSAEYRYLALC
ncbi:MAG: hypothetical protein IJV43_05470 [Oscillospiraceae bacterium]|nr:hypothetical protein [Oscillospiraceae bacterium]